MDTILDPIKILLCGGSGVGKTSIIRRLAGLPFQEEYSQTSGINIAEFVVPLKNKMHELKITIIDVGSELIHFQDDSNFTYILLNNVHAIVLLIDCTNMSSLKDLDNWMEFFSRNTEITPDEDDSEELEDAKRNGISFFYFYFFIFLFSYIFLYILFAIIFSYLFYYFP
jgi:GTPase SAR1 family protein